MTNLPLLWIWKITSGHRRITLMTNIPLRTSLRRQSHSMSASGVTHPNLVLWLQQIARMHP
ncbi:MAG: hypothetical protein F2527_04425 [Actinobacteria bacterium]|nr:hypothetical protein [Actinomycetota bacterium]